MGREMAKLACVVLLLVLIVLTSLTSEDVHDNPVKSWVQLGVEAKARDGVQQRVNSKANMLTDKLAWPSSFYKRRLDGLPACVGDYCIKEPDSCGEGCKCEVHLHDETDDDFYCEEKK